MTLEQRKHQNGASLIVGLVLLLVATLVVFAGVRGTQMQERMTSNLNNKAISYMAAEAGAARFAEWLFDEIDTSGWPGEGQPADGSVGNRGGEFRFVGVTWDAPRTGRVSFVSVGETVIDGQVLAESLVRVQLEGPAGRGIPPTIAPYVCYEVGCELKVGGNATVDGRVYELPEDYPCTGNNCRTEAPDPPRGVMAVYMPDALGKVCTTHAGGTCYEGGGDPDIRNVTGGEYTYGDPPTTEEIPSIVMESSAAEEDNPGLASLLQDAPTGEDWAAFIRDEFDGESKTTITSSNVSETLPNGAVNPREAPGLYEVTGGNAVEINSNSNLTGVLVVRADTTLELRGTMNFEGLILIEDGGRLDLSNGNATIYGSVVSLGRAAEADLDADLTGNISLRYSDEAIDRVNRRFAGEKRVLTWVEEVGPL